MTVTSITRISSSNEERSRHTVNVPDLGQVTEKRETGKKERRDRSEKTDTTV